MDRRRGGSQIRPSSVDHDARRVRRLGAPHLAGFRPAGRVSFPVMGKKPKDRRGRLTSPSGTGSLRLQFVLPRTPGIYGGPISGGDWSLSGAGGTTTAPATAPLPLSLRNQDGLVCWTKQARLIAQGLISVEGNWRAGLGPARPLWIMTPVGRDDSARRILQGFALRGEFLSQRWERNQRIAGGNSHRRREQVPSGSSSFSPGPPSTGDTPAPFHRSSGAQNAVSGLIPPGPPGPDAAQNSSLHHFATAPDSDQPWQRMRVGGALDEAVPNEPGTGESGTRPYGAISVTRNTMAAAAAEPLLLHRTL